MDRLAHAPFSERLPDTLIVAMAHGGRRAIPARTDSGRAPGTAMTWVSTLDIHGWGAPTPEQGVAIDNVRRFVAAGGSVVYGTDLGNGPLPLGVNPRELRALAAAGLGGDALLRALTSDDALGAVTYIPGAPPEKLAELDRLDGPDELADITRWLAGAVTLYPADVLHPDVAPPSGTTREDQP